MIDSHVSTDWAINLKLIGILLSFFSYIVRIIRIFCVLSVFCFSFYLFISLIFWYFFSIRSLFCQFDSACHQEFAFFGLFIDGFVKFILFPFLKCIFTHSETLPHVQYIEWMALDLMRYKLNKNYTANNRKWLHIMLNCMLLYENNKINLSDLSLKKKIRNSPSKHTNEFRTKIEIRCNLSKQQIMMQSMPMQSNWMNCSALCINHFEPYENWFLFWCHTTISGLDKPA